MDWGELNLQFVCFGLGLTNLTRNKYCKNRRKARQGNGCYWTLWFKEAHAYYHVATRRPFNFMSARGIRLIPLPQHHRHENGCSGPYVTFLPLATCHCSLQNMHTTYKWPTPIRVPPWFELITWRQSGPMLRGPPEISHVEQCRHVCY